MQVKNENKPHLWRHHPAGTKESAAYLLSWDSQRHPQSRHTKYLTGGFNVTAVQQIVYFADNSISSQWNQTNILFDILSTSYWKCFLIYCFLSIVYNGRPLEQHPINNPLRTRRGITSKRKLFQSAHGHLRLLKKVFLLLSFICFHNEWLWTTVSLSV